MHVYIYIYIYSNIWKPMDVYINLLWITVPACFPTVGIHCVWFLATRLAHIMAHLPTTGN